MNNFNMKKIYKRVVGSGEICEILSIAPKNLSKWVRKGCVVKLSYGKYDLKASIEASIKFRKDERFKILIPRLLEVSNRVDEPMSYKNVETVTPASHSKKSVKEQIDEMVLLEKGLVCKRKQGSYGEKKPLRAI